MAVSPKHPIGTKVRRGTGRSSTEEEILVRFFGGMKVIPAKEDIKVFLCEADAEKSIPGDPEHCVLATGLSRTTGGIAVVFRTVAYISIPDENGFHVEYFLNPTKTRALHKNYDETRRFDPGGYIFKRPYPSSTLDAKLERTRKRTPVIKGSSFTIIPRTAPVPIISGSPRPSGSGLVHFISRNIQAGKPSFISSQNPSIRAGRRTGTDPA